MKLQLNWKIQTITLCTLILSSSVSPCKACIVYVVISLCPKVSCVHACVVPTCHPPELLPQQDMAWSTCSLLWEERRSSRGKAMLLRQCIATMMQDKLQGEWAAPGCHLLLFSASRQTPAAHLPPKKASVGLYSSWRILIKTADISSSFSFLGLLHFVLLFPLKG